MYYSCQCPIPEEELRTLFLCVSDAWKLALAGETAAGRDLLDLGVAWAEAPPVDPWTGAAEPRAPYSELLTDEYRRALARYEDRFRRAEVVTTAADQSEPIVAMALALQSQGRSIRERALRARAIAAATRERARELASVNRGLRGPQPGSLEPAPR